MKRIASIVSLFLLAAVAAGSAEPATTVILVRHAEKAGSSGDVALSPAGEERARELARILTGTSIAAIYETQWIRTRQTAAPLAEAHHLKPVVIQSSDAYAGEIAAAILRDHKGETVVVVGHSNSTPELMKALGVPNPPAIADSEYDNLFLVFLAEGIPARLITLKYGAR